MSSIMGQIEAEHLELFALEFGKIAESDFVYTLASTNIDQSAPNMKITHATKYIQQLIKMHIFYMSKHQFGQCSQGSKLGHGHVPGYHPGDDIDPITIERSEACHLWNIKGP